MTFKLGRTGLMTRLVRFLKSGWEVPGVVFLLLFALAPAGLSTSSPDLDLAGISVKDMGLAGEEPVPPMRQLAVPYEAQGPTRWCFEASLSMALQYYGKAISPTDIAHALGNAPNESTGIIEIFLGPVESYLRNWPDLSVRQHIGNWSFSHYRELLNAGVPVIVFTFGLPGHTVVVTGYSEEESEDYLYVNDPSGCYTKESWGTGETRQARVGWSKFSRQFWSEMVMIRRAD